MSLDMRGRQFGPGGARPHFDNDSTWGLLIEELPDRRTRVVVSGYWSLRPRWLQPIMSFIFLEHSHWIMQTCQFANLKRRAELEPAAVDQTRVSATAGAGDAD
jgi:proline iminopeptidase